MGGRGSSGGGGGGGASGTPSSVTQALSRISGTEKQKAWATDIIDGYADAEEMYQEHLTTIMKKALLSVQSENMDRYIKSMLGNIM